MSKAGAPRPRYVAFRIASTRPVSRRAFGNALKGRARHDGFDEALLPQLTRFEHPHGIVHCDHAQLAAVRVLLGRINWIVDAAAKVPIKVETLSSSGTIKSLTDRLGVLGTRGEAPPKAPRKPAAGRPGPAPARRTTDRPGRRR